MNLSNELLTEDLVADAYEAAWRNARCNLQLEYGDEAYKSWLSKLMFVEYENGVLTLSAPTQFVRDWIVMHFDKRLSVSLRTQFSNLKKLALIVSKAQKPESAPQVEVKSVNQECLTRTLESRFTFDNFIEGRTNKFALEAVKNLVKKARGSSGSTPLFVHGHTGVGKTHLLHAAAWKILETQPSANVICVSAEKFMHQFITAMQANALIQFKNQYRSCDVLIMDDLQFMCGKSGTQDEFLYILDSLIEQKRKVLIACDRPPSHLAHLDVRLRSRLGGGLVVDIEDADEDLRFNILSHKAGAIGVAIPEDVLQFLSTKITSSIREMEGALNRVVVHSRITGTPITVANVRSTLRELLRASAKNVSISDIKTAVAKKFGISVDDLSSKRRDKKVAVPRQIAMYISKQLTTVSLFDIAHAFGKKEHTTVMHGVRHIKGLIDKDPYVADEVRELLEEIKGVSW